MMLAGYCLVEKNQYDGEQHRGESFTVSWMKNEKEKQEEKYLTSFRCKKHGHYLNECKEKLPKNIGNKKCTFLLIMS